MNKTYQLKHDDKENETLPSIVDSLHIPRDLVLEFLVTFARFEFALKRADFVVGNKRGVLANWNEYADLIDAFGEEALQQVFQEADYLESNPPLKQIKKDGKLDWAPRDPEKSRIRGILLDLRTVRNNLFHGGKFPGQHVAEPSRDEQLIRSCLATLKALVALPAPNPVAQYFSAEV